MSSQQNSYYDAVVIGSGFGGPVAALRLAEKGYRVLVIEKGKWPIRGVILTNSHYVDIIK